MDECKCFREKMGQLHSALQAARTDVESLTIKLYSESMVGEGLRDEVCDGGLTPCRAATKLLSAVESRIKSHPSEIDVFVEAFGSFPPWKDLADEMNRTLFLMNSRQVQAELESGRPTYSTRSSDPCISTTAPTDSRTPVQHSRSQPSSQPPVSIRIDSLVLTTLVTPSPTDPLHVGTIPVPFRSAPAPHKSSDGSHIETRAPTSRAFMKASSPLSNSSHDLVLEHPNSTSSLPTLPEEVGEYSSPECSLTLQVSRQPLSSLSSQSSTASSTEEEIQSMRGTMDNIAQKYHNMKWKLRDKDKKMKAIEEDLAAKQETYEAAMATANKENRDLCDRMKSLQLENNHFKDELIVARERIVASNLQKQHLLTQLQGYHAEVKEYQERCEKLEAQVREANQEIDFYAKYQIAEVKMKEQEDEIAHCRVIIKEHEAKIEVLETEIEVLVSVDQSITYSTSFGSSLELFLQESSNSTDSP